MEELNFEIRVKASSAKVWQVLWNDKTYRQWAACFHEGSYALTDWKEGSRIHFLIPEGDGMYSTITECRPNEYMAIKHLGELRNFKEQENNSEANSWNGSMETYSLNEENGITTLHVSLMSLKEYEDYFNKTFPMALDSIKKLAEHPIVLTVKTNVSATIEKVWENWTKPEHITGWNNASEDWHTPKAINDLKEGGKFVYTMAAKDGSFSFDFGGVYDKIETHKHISYTMEDGRKARIDFVTEKGGISITEAFDAEEMNSLELQQGGWQAILDNFKKYSETKH